MANRDGKLILRTLKNISASISVDGGGGTVVVTELPEVGEEHTVYELHQEMPADFPWLLTEIDRTGIYPMPDYPFIVVETEEQVTQEYLAFPDDYSGVIVFVKNTNNVYVCHIEHLEDDDSFVKNIVLPKEHSLYNNIAILKDFDYHVTDTSKGQEPTRKPAIILDGTGHFLDGTVFNYDDRSNVVPLVLTEAKNPIVLSDKLIGSGNYKDINNTSELPTAKQAVDGNMCDIDGNVIYPVFINTQNKLGYENETRTDTYSWNSEFQYFVDLEVEDVPENPAHYYGPLEWTTYPISVVNKIDLSLLDIAELVFNPQPAHTEISYWIYTGEEWVNMDEIGQISNTGAIFVEADSFVDLTQEKFYGNGKELEVEFIETTPEGEEVSTGYAIIKRVPIDTQTELTVSIWPQNGINYNGQTFYQGDTITVIGAGIIYLSFMAM